MCHERNTSGSFIKVSYVNRCFGCSVEQQKHLKEQVQKLDDRKIENVLFTARHENPCAVYQVPLHDLKESALQ